MRCFQGDRHAKIVYLQREMSSNDGIDWSETYAFPQNGMAYGMQLPQPGMLMSSFFQPRSTTGDVYIRAVHRPTWDRLRVAKQIDFTGPGGLNVDQNTILYHPVLGYLNQRDMPNYYRMLSALVDANCLIFPKMKDLYWFLYHIGPALRKEIRSIIIEDITSGSYIKASINLLRTCDNLVYLAVQMCRVCGELRCTPAKWRYWRQARGLGRIANQRFPRGLHVHPRPSGMQMCEGCCDMVRETPRNLGQIGQRRNALRRYLVRPRV